MEDKNAERILSLVTESINDRAAQFRSLNARMERCEAMCRMIKQNQEELLDLCMILYARR